MLGTLKYALKVAGHQLGDKGQQGKGFCSECSLPGFAGCLLDAEASSGRQ